jgi:putative ABC transport system substrate-binding protein
MSGMGRREFVALLGGAATWPLAALGQQAAMPVIGFLDSGSLEMNRGRVVDFIQGLADAGYVEGKNVAIEYRWANAQIGNLRALANDLVNRRVNVIVASGAVGPALAAKAATSAIPIVIAGGADPVRYGLVASLNRPGGNVTGITVIHGELVGKRLELMRDLVPDATKVAYLTGDLRDEIAREDTNELVAIARALGRQVVVLECRSEGDIETAFATLVQGGASALVVEAFAPAFNNRDRIVKLAAHHKIPAIYPQPQYVYRGGLMSYAAFSTLRELSVQYVAPILKGAKPADLPVQRPTTFRLAINLKTAKALSLDVPPTLLARADEVIE